MNLYFLSQLSNAFYRITIMRYIIHSTSKRISRSHAKIWNKIIKFMRLTEKYTWLDHERNQNISKYLQIKLILENVLK
jgi:hypothetical protein